MTSASPLTPEQIDFVSSGVSISAASCHSGGIPSMSRALGCRVSADGSELTLFFSATAAAALIDDIRRSGSIAAVFTLPATHETLQVKSQDAHVVGLETGDAGRVAAYQENFTTHVVALGFQESLLRTLLACPLDDLVGVRFSATARFSQTPGPHAGEPIGSAP